MPTQPTSADHDPDRSASVEHLLAGDSGRGDSGRETPVTEVSFRAMATEFVVMLSGEDVRRLESAVSALEALEGIEGALTVYRNSSEVSRVNLAAADGPVRVSESTLGLLRRAVRWSRLTEGAFDITAGPLIDVWGFTGRRGRKPSSEEVAAARARVGYRHLELDDESGVRFGRVGMAINLGAIGKGYALDRIADQLADAGATNFLIHGGQSSVLARGDQTPGSGTGWAVGLAHPTKPRRRIAGLWLRDAALGTSGSGKQFFHHRGRRFGHVIDPRTGEPAGDLLSLTVIAPTAVDADACATGLFVCGGAEAKRLAGPIGEAIGAEVPLILVRGGARQDEVSVETCGKIEWIDPPADAIAGTPSGASRSEPGARRSGLDASPTESLKASSQADGNGLKRTQEGEG